MDAQGFAAEWETGWNSHDLDRILSHYAPEILFRSAKAAALVGAGDVRGRGALRDYWGRALAAQPDLRFKVVDVFEGHEMIVITYRNHRGVLAAETLRFGAGGLVVEASACHRNEEAAR